MVMMLDTGKKKVNLLLKILLFSARSSPERAMRTGKEWIHCTGGVSKRFGPVVMMLDF